MALRYFNVYGPRQALSNPYTGVCAIFSARLLNDERPLIFEDGERTRDFVHVRERVQAYNVLALDSDGADDQAVSIGSGRPDIRSDESAQRRKDWARISSPKSSAANAKGIFDIASPSFRLRAAGHARTGDSQIANVGAGASTRKTEID